MLTKKSQKNYQWIATLYFFQSIPFITVSLISTLMYQQQGISNANAALITSLLMIPWAIKPIWAPFLEQIATKKKLTIYTQGILSLVFVVLALSMHNSYFLIISLFAFFALAFFSSVHDIVSDGVYLLNLTQTEQRQYVAWRGFFYQMGRLGIKGGLLILCSWIAMSYQLEIWQLFFGSLFICSFLFTCYHYLSIPDVPIKIESEQSDSGTIFKSLCSNSQLYPLLGFVFLYNFSDAQIQRVIPLFLLDPDGLALDLSRVGELYGVSGTLALMAGIFISGLVLSRYTIESCLKYFTPLLLIGHFSFLALVCFKTSNTLLCLIIFLNQFIFGIVNGVYMGYLLVIANKTNYPMSMYTLCTSVMALSYVIFGSVSGWIEWSLGYTCFFLYIFIANLLIIRLTYRVVNKYA